MDVSHSQLEQTRTERGLEQTTRAFGFEGTSSEKGMISDEQPRRAWHFLCLRRHGRCLARQSGCWSSRESETRMKMLAHCCNGAHLNVILEGFRADTVSDTVPASTAETRRDGRPQA